MAKRHAKHSRRPKAPPRDDPPAVPSYWVVRGLVAVAMAVSLYLLSVSWSGGALAGCGPESSCHKVLTSRWAYWFGIPVSLVALVAYAGILLATFGVTTSASSARRNAARALLTVLAITVGGSALWFIGLQFFVLRSVCPYCMAAHGCGLVAATILLFRTPDPLPSKKIRPSERPRQAPIWRHLAVGLGCVVVLIGGQIMHKPKTGAIAQLPNRGVATTTGLPTNGSKTAASPTTPRTISLHDGQIELNLDELPLIGSPRAPHAMVSLFDYTCHHCREMHELLHQAHAAFSNQLAIVCLPMPLDANCNPAIKRTADAHLNACEYARLGLAVWRADRTAFTRFDSWLFGHPSVPSLLQARQYAEQLVGREPLQRALADDWVNLQIERDVALYQLNHRKTRNSTMPQILVGSRIGFGSLSSVEDLFRLLETEFGLKRSG
ncbi:MAG TPA: vitamin K epoxide reductase family protein [Verrucomicrobiae bacterium]|nr:vitamin K epoxide reductase family protein [Verrucomicrobiae bacterium]